MMKFYFLVGLLWMWSWLGTSECKSQGSLGARSAGMADISVVAEDVWSLSNNPAGLGRIEHLTLATNLEQRFLMKELGYYALGLTHPAGNGCFGMNSISSGYSEFIEQLINVGYGRSFGQLLITGLSLVYVYQKAGEQTSPLHQISYRLGAIAHLSENVSLGFSAFNPFDLHWKSRDYATLPGNIKIGVLYRHSPAMMLLAECEKGLDLPPVFKAGFELNQNEIFFIRGGIRLFPVTYAFGAGFRQNRYLIDLSAYYHQYLGFTPQFSFQYHFK